MTYNVGTICYVGSYTVPPRFGLGAQFPFAFRTIFCVMNDIGIFAFYLAERDIFPSIIFKHGHAGMAVATIVNGQGYPIRKTA